MKIRRDELKIKNERGARRERRSGAVTFAAIAGGCRVRRRNSAWKRQIRGILQTELHRAFRDLTSTERHQAALEANCAYFPPLMQCYTQEIFIPMYYRAPKGRRQPQKYCRVTRNSPTEVRTERAPAIY